MGLIKLHRSFVDIFRSTSDVTETDTSHALPTDSPHTNHRSFFRRRNSRASITPQSSFSSLKSPGGTPVGSDDESTNSSNLKLERHEKDHKDRKLKLRSKHRHPDHHHSLKRFFKILHPKEHLDHVHSPLLKQKFELPLLPLSAATSVSQKYDVGKFVGSGASGLVNLVSALDDPSKVYALKKFRAKLSNESDHDYITKVKNEYLVGEFLNHQNLIHTIELIKEEPGAKIAPEFFIIMEYCPHDFFTLVMSGLMRKDEIFCYFKQIVNGTAFLHASGIAHRDLKLDNCVVDKNGILKLIDFGSAFQFRKPLDYVGGTGGDDIILDDGHKLVFARGIVGSDPYLAPEVFMPVSPMGYDPRLADVWSIAIIFCCMVLKRFPWKIPKESDVSFKAFCEPPQPEQPLEEFEQLTMKTRELPRTGANRLLSLLPTASRSLIKGMLTVDTKKRYHLEDITSSEFYQNIDHCHYYEEGEKIPPQLIWDPKAHTLAVSESMKSTQESVVTAAGNVENAENTSKTGELEKTEELEKLEKTEELEKLEKSEKSNNADTSLKDPEAAKSESSFLDKSSRDISNSEEKKQHGGAVSSATEPRASPAIGTLIKGKSHRHHLVTEEELEKMHQEKAKQRQEQKQEQKQKQKQEPKQDQK